MSTTTLSYKTAAIGTSPVVLLTAPSGVQSALIGLTVANTTAAQIAVSVYVTSGSTNYYVVKAAPIPVGSSLSLFGMDGRTVLNAGDTLSLISNTAASCDALASVLQTA